MGGDRPGWMYNRSCKGGSDTIAAKREKKYGSESGSASAPSRWEREDPDVQLMLRFRGGEESAFEELVERNTHKVHALAYRFLGDVSCVEDVTQEVFLRVYRNAERYTPTAKFSTWLYRITANLCFNVMRRRRRRNPVPLDGGTGDEGKGYHREVPDPRSAPPGENMDADELRRKVVEAIALLPDNQRIAIVLNKYEGKSYDEIASALGCSGMAVKSLLSRARGNLRHTLMRYLRH